MVDDLPPLEAASPQPQTSPGSELDTAQFHDLIQLRIAVFVVEQKCPYAELDGLDLLPTTTHVWFADATGPTASLRIYAATDDPADKPLWRIGRVVTRQDSRSQGLAKQLMVYALARFGRDDTALEAQSQLHDLYANFGYVRTGPEYVDEDGIPHIPMTRSGRPSVP